MKEILSYHIPGVSGAVTRVKFGERTVEYWGNSERTDKVLIAHDGQCIFDTRTAKRNTTWKLADRWAEELLEIAQEIETEKLIALTVEVDGDQYLCYNAQTMAFVCQGRNLEEIRERFSQRYPSKNAAIYNGDESAVRTLKQQLKAMHENSSSIRSTS